MLARITVIRASAISRFLVSLRKELAPSPPRCAAQQHLHIWAPTWQQAEPWGHTYPNRDRVTRTQCRQCRSPMDRRTGMENRVNLL